MAKLIYSAIASLDGYVADEQGPFDWAMPDEEVHSFINEQERRAGTHLYGRRMYETMVVWETMDTGPPEPAALREYAEIWRAADKVVYSRTRAAPASARTRIEREFDPEAVRAMKASAEREISVGGAELAGHALRAGLVDECHLYLNPVIVGGGALALPRGFRIDLTLLDEHRFAGGVVYLRYALVDRGG